MSDKKTTTMLDLSSPAFNYTAAADALNTVNAVRGMREANKSAVELDRREKIHRALQRFGLATAGASMASPLTAIFTETAGGVADFIDGVLYNLEGEHGYAALSYAAILPVVGGAIAAKRVVRQAKEIGDDTVIFYRGIGGDVPTDKLFQDVPVGSGKGWYFMESKIPKKIAVGEGYNPKKDVFSLNTEWDEALVDVMGGGPVGGATTQMYATTSPETALWYAAGQRASTSRPLQVLKFEIPVKELKRLENIKDASGAKAFSTNDYFLKKIHGLGTGKLADTRLVNKQIDTITGMNVGFRNVAEPISGISPGNNVAIFERGLDAADVTILKGNSFDDIVKKYPELKGNVLNNESIVKSLKRRGMSINSNNYNFYEYTKK